jgi:hypothetical protein
MKAIAAANSRRTVDGVSFPTLIEIAVLSVSSKLSPTVK